MGGITLCGEAMNLPLVQRFKNSPVLIIMPSETGSAGSHLPVRVSTCKPGTADKGSKVMKLWSLWGEIPNWLSSGSTAG